MTNFSDILGAFWLALSTFTVLPAPRRTWGGRAMAFVPFFMPLVGLIIGATWALLLHVMRVMNLPTVLQTVLCGLWPHLMSGCLHLDGLMDVADAVASRKPLEDRLRILKDPHLGAFGAVALVVLLSLTYAGAHGAVQGVVPIALLALPALPRAVVAVGLMLGRPMPHSGMAAALVGGRGAGGLAVAVVQAALLIVAAALLLPSPAPAAALVAGAAAALTLAALCRSFGGISGDLCGAAICVGEAAGLITLSIWGV